MTKNAFEILHHCVSSLLRIQHETPDPELHASALKALADLEEEFRILRSSLESLSLQFAEKIRNPSPISSQSRSESPTREIFRSWFSDLPVPVCLVDQNGNFHAKNHAWKRYFGFTEEQQDCGEISQFAALLDNPEALLAFWGQCRRENFLEKHVESPLILRGKNACFIHSIAIDSDERTLWIWLFLDQTEIRKLRQELKESEERFQLAAQGANDGLWDWHLKTNELYFSPRWLNMLGYSEKDFHNNLADWLNLVHPADKKELSKKLHEHLTKKNTRFRHEYRIQDKMGEYRWVLAQGVLILDENGNPYRFAGSQTDITEIKRMEKQLIHDSTHDLLTNLPNRLLFREELGKMLHKTASQTPPPAFAILQLNLDQFQLINNGLGHLFGDQVLMIVAGRLLSLVSGQDIVARLGGDEFAILLAAPQTPQSVAEFAALILSSLAQPIQVHGQEIVLSAGIGIVIRTPEHTSVGQLLGDAATAMHHAKAMSPGSWVLFNEEMRANAITRIQLESKLRRAIEQHEIQVFFQPIIHACSGKVAYFEALVRWFDPEKGLITPGAFIPLAEETSLILPLGEFVLRRSCQELMKWHAAGFRDIAVAVNLSPKQFQQPNIHERIQQVLAETGTPGNRLSLEITESQVMENPAQAIAILKRLRELQVEVSIDDFGTGYSSLAYLKRFPLSTLKIDRTFVEGLPEEHDDAEITRAIIALAQSLKLEIIAEGVENESQAIFLKNAGCLLLQGFLFSKPMPAQDVIPWLKNYAPHHFAPSLFRQIPEDSSQSTDNKSG